MDMMLDQEAATVDVEQMVDCARLRTMGLAELLYHALVEWGQRVGASGGGAYNLAAGTSS